MGRSIQQGVFKPEIAIRVGAPLWRQIIPDLRKRARRAALCALDGANEAGAGRAGAGLSLLFEDDARIAELNRRHRAKEGPTNVLSFPAPDQRHVPLALRSLGDVVLAAETILAEAERDAIPPADHMCHMVVHGVLHVLGFDHQVEAEAQAMEALESAILARLGIADPYTRGGS